MARDGTLLVIGVSRKLPIGATVTHWKGWRKSSAAEAALHGVAIIDW